MNKVGKLGKNVIIGGVGILCGVLLIGNGIYNHMSEKQLQSDVKPKPIVIKPKVMSEEEQFEQPILKSLITKVSNRFDDASSSQRAIVLSKELIKDFIEKQKNEHVKSKTPFPEKWDVTVENVSAQKLALWRQEQVQKLDAEIEALMQKQVSENSDPVIGRNDPLYLLQEKKIIQRELYENWSLILKPVVEKQNTPSIVVNTPQVDTPTTQASSAVEKEDSQEIKAQRQSEIDQLEINKEKTTKIVEDLVTKDDVLKTEFVKQEKILKDLEDELQKTKDELTQIEKNLQELNKTKEALNQQERILESELKKDKK